MKPRIAITLGDPSGIGPEIVAKALRDARVRRVCEPVVLGQSDGVTLGKPSREAGFIAITALKNALALLAAKQVQALVTAPVSKESFSLADHAFPGHTEFLAHEAGVREAGMLMVAGPMRALLMTRHLPLAQVSKHLTLKTIVHSAELAHTFLRRIGIGRPRIVLCGINPHAGDRGLLGTEELRVFGPARKTLQKKGIPVQGPVAADSAFRDMSRGQWDLALAAYHDQGMIPLKVFAADRLVNITLGLPYIRTSPGHGTAHDIAGKGVADARPMIEAILLAAKYSTRLTP